MIFKLYSASIAGLSQPALAQTVGLKALQCNVTK